MRPASGYIDRRYSADAAEAVAWDDVRARLADAQLAWIVTIKADGRPHATPMVPVVHDGKVYFHTGSNEVKYGNLMADPHVLVLVGDTCWDRGLDVSVEGIAEPVTDGELMRRLAELYNDRWDGSWQLEVKDDALVPRVPGIQLVFFEVTPQTARAHAKSAPSSQTTYRF
jgi:general stress protein 26